MSKDASLLSEYRTCSECDRISATGTCLESAESRPNQRAPRQCIHFVPFRDAYDLRTGRELWPCKAASESHGGGVKGFLAGLLALGPESSDTIIAKAIEAGISKRSIQRAAEQMLVIRTKCGFRDGWVWALPNAEGAKE